MLKSLTVAALLLSACAASAQNPACNGQLVGMRVSKLKPGGTMAGFADAVKANAAWYASHGLKDDRIAMAPVFEASDGSDKPSVDKAMSIHIYGSATAPKKDAAWTAFVDKYKANSSIESEVKVCLPKGTMTLR